MRTLDQGKRSARRTHILQVAEGRFAKNGFHATGMAEICAAAKMSPGNLYRYFKSKDEIIRAIVERDRLELVALAAQVGRNGDVVASIVSLAEEIMRRAAEPGYARVAVEVLAEAGRDKAIGELYRKTDKEICAALEAALKSAARAGQLFPGLDCKAAACWLVALGDGAVARFAADSATHRRALVPTLKQMIRRFLLMPNEGS
ncbi:MAG: TetR/AcrR family transcriptional regulator [Hyphomonadaceae bacterium]|nr:TetR/AcrR family transcriptional regulator [Hyphomonadaceae bacterium]